MNPVTLGILVLLVFMVLAGSRRMSLLALLASALYLSQNQGLHIMSLNLFPTRILEIALVARVVIRGERPVSSLNAIDRAVLWLYAYVTVVFLLRSNDGLAYQLGVAVDAFLVYFSCRAMIDSPESFRWLLRSFVLLLIPFVVIVILERERGQSPLAFMGWGSYDGTWMREGVVRCFGSLRHPSLLGTIGVSFIPVLIGMAFNPEDRKRAILGIVLCVVVVACSNSGGPISGVIAGCVAWIAWKFRRNMRKVRWGIVIFIVAAAIYMKAPVWYLIAHVSQLTGGDGWHRAYLMDVSFQNLGKWWFAGMPVAETADWFPYMLATTSGADITNQFISFGLTAGIVAIALFIYLLTKAFSGLGNALQAVRAASPQPSEPEYLLWGMGAMLAAHIINWFGITYFDQTYVFWFAELAAVSSISDWYRNEPLEPAMQPEEMETASEMEEEEPLTAQ